MTIKLNVAYLLSMAGILSATTIAGITPVKAAEIKALQAQPVTSTTMQTIASHNKTATANTKLSKKAKGTLVDVASANGSFKTLTAALKAAGLVDTLQGCGPFTVFAPTDAAFAKLPKGTVENLLKPENKAQLVRLLTYHVVSGEVLSKKIKSGKVKTIQGDTVNVLVQSNGVTINDSNVTAVDVKASNGVIHVIDTVLMPPAEMATNTLVDVASANGSFKTLTAALKAAGLVDTLKGNGPFTVFAPTDAAFARLPKGTVENLLKPENKTQLVKLLTYHVVSGEVLSKTIKSGKVKTIQGNTVNVLVQNNGVTINDSNVTAVDVKASNGVIHVIDTVLMPPAEMATNTLVDVASANGSFKTLTAALKAAGLVDTLKGNGPFTVFAPTDAAFARLPKGTVENLLKPENKAQLVNILTYHVVSGEVLSKTIKSGQVKTVQGNTVNVLVQSNGVTINDSNVTAVDVKASNGVIHVIDTVLMPPAQ